MIVDSHCHLDYPGLAEDEAGVIERAKAAGVTSMVHVAAKPSGWPVGIALAERRPECSAPWVCTRTRQAMKAWTTRRR